MSDQPENPNLELSQNTENGNNSNSTTETTTNDKPTANNKLTAKTKAEERAEAKAIAKAEAKAKAKAIADEKAKAKAIAKAKNAEEKKVKKTSSLPKSHLAISQLGQKVAISWPTHFANLNVPDTDARTLAQDAADMLQLIREANDSDSRKLQNTVDLANVNALINTGTNALKAAIKLHNPTVKKLSTIYAAYGLETNKSGANKFAADNAIRNEQILQLIDQLQTANNTIVGSLQAPFTLRDWINLQQQHATLWANSENLRQLRSNNANEIAKLYEKIRTQLKRVYQYMTGVYSREELPRKKRLMGFLKESF